MSCPGQAPIARHECSGSEAQDHTGRNIALRGWAKILEGLDQVLLPVSAYKSVSPRVQPDGRSIRKTVVRHTVACSRDSMCSTLQYAGFTLDQSASVASDASRR